VADGMATYKAFSTVDELERVLFDDLKWVLTNMGSKLLLNAASVADEPSVGREISEEQPEFSEPISPETRDRPDEMGNLPNHASHGIFLSYRREDSAPYARSLQIELKQRFPATQVFLDLDSIEAGLDFAQVIQRAISSSAVLVALIGRQWTTIVDEEGRRRLDNPDDYVRYEIQTALELGRRVIPVLVDGAKPLQQKDLPSQLQSLTRLNALDLSYSRYQYDADRLLGVIERVLTAGPSSD
jgi:hypothetical protein